MGKFQYEWWTVEAREATGKCTWEVKARSKDGAVRQIEKMAEAHDLEVQGVRPDFCTKIFWETLSLDRTGYQRRF